MSLTRAFTTRRAKRSLLLTDSADGIPQRSHTTKGSIGGAIRNKISAPVQLIHTTNMLSYNAPDINPKSASSTASSVRSDDGFDSTPTIASSPPTSPDSPFPSKRPGSPEPNHLSCYFVAPGQSLPGTAPTEAPTIPRRAPSHTKKSYDGLNRHRSASRLSEQSTRSLSSKASFSFSRSSSTSTSTSTSIMSRTSLGTHHHVPKGPTASPASPPPSAAPLRKLDVSETHPFGHELAQVTELAEEYGVSDDLLKAADDEAHGMAQRGLLKFSAEDYSAEIQGLFSNFFVDAKAITPLWI